MKKKVDKIIALVIACIMVFSLMPRSMNHVIASTTETASMTDATEAVTVDADDSEIENVSPTEDKEKDTEDEISDDSDVNSDTEDGQEPEEDTEEDTEEDVAFDSSVTCDGVVIRVTADEGVFPAGATLSAKRVSDSQDEAAGVADAVEEKRDNNVNVAASLTFDITVYDKDGNEIEPDTEKGEVKVSFSYPLIANKNLDTNVYHIKDEAGAPEAEKLNADEEGSIAEVTTDGFSYYTVEFTYGEKQYVMNGDTTISLSDILDYVGLSGEVSAVSVSDESLFSASKESGEWMVTAHQAFTSNEWMKVTVDGVEYEIVVTDEIIGCDNASTLASLLENAKDGDIIQVTADFDASSLIRARIPIKTGCLVTLDLNGHTISFGDGGDVFGTQANSAFLIKNGTFDYFDTDNDHSDGIIILSNVKISYTAWTGNAKVWAVNGTTLHNDDSQGDDNITTIPTAPAIIGSSADWTCYNDFQTAFNNADSNKNNILLLIDSNLTADANLNKTGIVMDLSQYTLNTGGYTFSVTHNTGTNIIRNGVLNGDIDMSTGNGEVKFADMTVTGTITNSGHPVTINDGTYNNIISTGTGTVTITDGYFGGELTGDAFEISGGHFKNKPTDAQLSNGYIIIDSSVTTGGVTYPYQVVQGYKVTLNKNDGTVNSGDITQYQYGVGATLPTDITKTGYYFLGWYDNSGLTGTAVTSISATDSGDKEYWAKWVLNDATYSSTESFTYDGTEKTAVTGSNVTITGQIETNAGDYTATVTPKDGHSWADVTTAAKQVPWKILNADLTGVSVSQKEDIYYTGSSQTAEVTTAATSVNNQPVTFTYSASETGTYTSSVPAFTEAGSYTVYYKATAPNHNEVTGSFIVTISKATITVTEGITAEDKQYDATTDATLDFSGAVLDGKCGNDDVSVTATGTFCDKNVGEDKTVNITGLELTGDKAGNYELAATGNQKTTTASITERVEVVQNPDGTTTTTTTTTDEDGNEVVTEETEKDGKVIEEKETHYDEDGNVTKETVTEKDKDGRITKETETHYDEEGNVTQVTETTTSEDGKTRTVVVTDGEGNSINTYEEVVSPDSNAAKFVKKLGEAPDTTMDNSVNDLADMLLNDDEKVEMEAGERVSMYLTIEDISETVDSQDKAKIAAVVAGAGLTEYYDINLYKKIGTADEQKITETSSPINMTLQISDELINTDPNIERSYVLVRLHEGTAAVVPANINLASKTASFGSDRFSIYAIVCIDKTTGSKTDAKVEVSKKTDDSTPLFPIIFMFVMSAAGSVFVARKRSMIL